MKQPFRFIIAAFISLAASLPAAAQIPSGYVQTTATVSALAGGTFGASWTNLSSSPQLGLLGCVSTFQTTVNGSFDAYGHFSVILADTAQICPTPSTWTFVLTFACSAGSQSTSFPVQVAVTGGGGTQDISSQITALLPATHCSAGGGGSTTVSPPPYSIQAANSTASGLTSDSAITLDTTNHAILAGGPILGNAFTLQNLSTIAASWTFDVSSPTTALNSLGAIPLSNLATIAANSLIGNPTASASTPTGLAVPNCPTALTWTPGTGLGCNANVGLNYQTVLNGTTTGSAVTQRAYLAVGAGTGLTATDAVGAGPNVSRTVVSVTTPANTTFYPNVVMSAGGETANYYTCWAGPGEAVASATPCTGSTGTLKDVYFSIAGCNGGAPYNGDAACGAVGSLGFTAPDLSYSVMCNALFAMPTGTTRSLGISVSTQPSSTTQFNYSEGFVYGNGTSGTFQPTPTLQCHYHHN